MCAALLMLTLGSSLVLITATEARIGGRFARGAAVLAAAEMALDRALLDLEVLQTWDLALAGVVTSGTSDGPPMGTRQVADVTLDLDSLTQGHRCGRPQCTEADLSAFTAERPWGTNNPRWQLFAWTRLHASSFRATPVEPIYTLVWIADDPAENDGDALRDGDSHENPGRGTLLVRAEAHGAGGLRRTLEATVHRPVDAMLAAGQLEVRAWREVR